MILHVLQRKRGSVNGPHGITDRQIRVADSAALLFSKRADHRGVGAEDIMQEARLALVRVIADNPEASEKEIFERCRARVVRVLRSDARNSARSESMTSMAA